MESQSSNFKYSIIVFLFLFLSNQVMANNTWEISYKKGLEIAKKKNKPVLLDIVAEWCGYCQKMQKEVYPSRSVQKLLKRFVLIRVDGEKQEKVSKKYGVRGFPTIVFLESNGKKIFINNGFLDENKLKIRLEKILVYVDREKKIIKDLKSHPENVMLNYKIGLFYYKKKQIKKSEYHFIKAITSKEAVSIYKIDALYNLSVLYMDKKDYKSAIKRWNEYIKKYPKQGKDSIYARYYRGISFYFISDKISAKSDLAWAAKNMKMGEDKKSAHRLLQTLN